MEVHEEKEIHMLIHYWNKVDTREIEKNKATGSPMPIRLFPQRGT
jgi:hypothetical protein